MTTITPTQQREIKVIEAVTTGTTCSAACWYAKEDSCRCFCGGINHGILLTDGAEQPRRMCTIKGVRYILGAIDIGWFKANSWDTQYRELKAKESNVPYYRIPYMNGNNAFTVLKSITPSQMKWPELSNRKNNWVRILWIREDAINEFDKWMEEN